jgi:hypothetical protein
MRTFLQALAGSFVGKVLASLFIAICAAIGFGPDRWAAFVIGEMPIPLLVARVLFLGLGALAIIYLVVSRLPSTRISQISLHVGEAGRFLSIADANTYGVSRTLNVQVKNNHKQSAFSDCKIQITEIEPPSGYNGPWVLKSNISLPAGDDIFIPIANYTEARNRDNYDCGDAFLTICTGGTAPKLSKGNQYVLTVRATATGSAPSEFKCTVWIDENGKLRIKEGR